MLQGSGRLRAVTETKGRVRPAFRQIGVVGYGVTGRAVVALARVEGLEVVVAEDNPSAAALEHARKLGLSLASPSSQEGRQALVAGCDVVVVSPGVPPTHWIFGVIDRSRIISEIEFAYLYSNSPIVAITGTNGKTTVTTLVDEMLRRSAMRSVAAGNIGTPLVEVARRSDLDVIVAEVSSFQLALCGRFRPAVATWLNLAEDHLDWHPSMQDYAASKAKIFQSQCTQDVAVVNRHDPVIMNAAHAGRARVVTFGRQDADYVVAGGRLVGPGGLELGTAELLPRALPHDLDNAIAAFATALEAGANLEGCRSGLQRTPVLPHRVEFVLEREGVRFYDDSKATTPSSVIAALRAFDHLVLIAGGRNKGLDFAPVAAFIARQAPGTLRALVTIGEAAPELARVFAGLVPIVEARSMNEAVRRARGFAAAGDAVVLSPGCASFDWYSSYEERGRDFVRAVNELGGARQEP